MQLRFALISINSTLDTGVLQKQWRRRHGTLAEDYYSFKYTQGRWNRSSLSVSGSNLMCGAVCLMCWIDVRPAHCRVRVST